MYIFADTSGKPVFVQQSKMKSLQLAMHTHGDNVHFVCTSEGAMPIYYKWFKNGKPLEKRRVDYRTNASHPILKLNDLVLSDNGNYTCKVWNRNGSIQYTFSLIVNGKRWLHNHLLL